MPEPELPEKPLEPCVGPCEPCEPQDSPEQLLEDRRKLIFSDLKQSTLLSMQIEEDIETSRRSAIGFRLVEAKANSLLNSLGAADKDCAKPFVHVGNKADRHDVMMDADDADVMMDADDVWAIDASGVAHRVAINAM